MTARRTIPAALLLALAGLVAAGPLSSTRVVAQSATVDPVLYSGMQWRSVGSVRGGRSIAVGGSDLRPHEYWFGAVGGGAWKTTDGGTTWAPMTDGKITSSSIGAIGVCQSNPDIVYIGGGEVAFRGNIIQGDGVYRTTDGGKTWTHLGLKDSQAVARLRVHPTDCDTVFAAVLGQTYNDHPERGVFKSTDGGNNWTHLTTADPSDFGFATVVHPDDASTAWFVPGIKDELRVPVENALCVMRTRDGGATFEALRQGLPQENAYHVVYRHALAIANDGETLAFGSTTGSVWISEDSGDTWERLSAELPPIYCVRFADV